MSWGKRILHSLLLLAFLRGPALGSDILFSAAAGGRDRAGVGECFRRLPDPGYLSGL